MEKEKEKEEMFSIDSIEVATLEKWLNVEAKVSLSRIFIWYFCVETRTFTYTRQVAL